MVRGSVTVWHEDEGWGVLVSPEAPSDVWAHFSAINAEGFRSLRVGETVRFDYIAVPGGQDGYAYRATLVVSDER